VWFPRRSVTPGSPASSGPAPPGPRAQLRRGIRAWSATLLDRHLPAAPLPLAARRPAVRPSEDDVGTPIQLTQTVPRRKAAGTTPRQGRCFPAHSYRRTRTPPARACSDPAPDGPPSPGFDLAGPAPDPKPSPGPGDRAWRVGLGQRPPASGRRRGPASHPRCGFRPPRPGAAGVPQSGSRNDLRSLCRATWSSAFLDEDRALRPDGLLNTLESELTRDAFLAGRWSFGARSTSGQPSGRIGRPPNEALENWPPTLLFADATGPAKPDPGFIGRDGRKSARVVQTCSRTSSKNNPVLNRRPLAVGKTRSSRDSRQAIARATWAEVNNSATNGLLPSTWASPGPPARSTGGRVRGRLQVPLPDRGPSAGPKGGSACFVDDYTPSARRGRRRGSMDAGQHAQGRCPPPSGELHHDRRRTTLTNTAPHLKAAPPLTPLFPADHRAGTHGRGTRSRSCAAPLPPSASRSTVSRWSRSRTVRSLPAL